MEEPANNGLGIGRIFELLFFSGELYFSAQCNCVGI
jgi:hypothetical protein